MSGYMWIPFHYAQDDSSEAALTPTVTESEKTVSDVNTGRETLDASSCIAKGKSSDHDSSTEKGVSSLTDDCCAGNEIESAESKSFATDDFIFPEEQTSDESQNIGANHQLRPTNDEDRPNSTLHDSEAGFDMNKYLLDFTSWFGGFFFSNMAITFGDRNICNIPADLPVPYLVLVMGILGLFTVSYVLVISNRVNLVGLTENEGTLIGLASLWLLILWNWQFFYFSSMDVKFDSTAKNYCNHEFYTFVILMNIFSALGFVMGLGLFFFDLYRRASSE